MGNDAIVQVIAIILFLYLMYIPDINDKGDE